MEAIIALIAVFIVSIGCYLKTKKPLLSLLVASLIMPLFVLFAEFVIPYSGGGASMWPIALVLASFAGVILSAFSIGIALFIQKREDK